MADKTLHISSERWHKEVMLGCFLGTIAVPSWDLLATTTSTHNCRIESRVASSSVYDRIAFEYRKPSPAGIAYIALFEV